MMGQNINGVWYPKISKKDVFGNIMIGVRDKEHNKRNLKIWLEDEWQLENFPIEEEDSEDDGQLEDMSWLDEAELGTFDVDNQMTDREKFAHQFGNEKLAWNLIGGGITKDYEQIKGAEWCEGKLTPEWKPNREVYSTTTMRYGDYLCGCRIVTKATDNQNEWLLSKFELEIGGSKILSGSLLYLHALTQQLDPQNKIETDVFENTRIIPLALFELIGRRRLDIVALAYHEVRVRIFPYQNSVQPLSEFKIEFCYGFYDTEIRNGSIRNASEMLAMQSQTWNEKIEDHITDWHYDIFLYNIFIIVWYVIDTSEFGEAQSLQPDIMDVQFDLDFDDDEGAHYSKTVEPSKIKKVRVGNYVGYFIPTNQMDLDQTIDVVGQSSLIPKSKIFGSLFNWSHTRRERAKIFWSNYQPGSQLFLETVNFNIARMMSGMLGMAFSH